MGEPLERQYLEVELYEIIQKRERRRKLILILLSLSVFLFLCGIPVYKERFPKWQSLRAARKISIEIEMLKTEAIRLKKPLLLTLADNGGLKIEQVNHCQNSGSEPRKVEEVLQSRQWDNADGEVSLLDEAESKKLNLALAVQNICFDPVSGADSVKSKKVMIVVPVKDLAETRLDRASYVEIESSSARISIN